MVRHSSTPRRLGSPAALLVLLSLPALAAALPGKTFEADGRAGVVADAPQLYELSSKSVEDASRPVELDRAKGTTGKTTTKKVTTTKKTTTEEPEETTTEGPVVDGPKGTWKGAYAFLLVLVPIFAAFAAVTCCDSSIVVVASRQPDVEAKAQVLEPGTVLTASIEHDIVYDQSVEFPKSAVKVSAGGLGKVAGQLQTIHPTDLISVHPIGGEKWNEKEKKFDAPPKYGFEQQDQAAQNGWTKDADLELVIDGVKQTVRVWRRTVPPPPPQRREVDPVTGQPVLMPQVTYLLLEHPEFRGRKGIYLDQPGSVQSLRFFALWNQAVGILIAREGPMVYQCPDYHTALAPWYALRACGKDKKPPRVAVVLHNAEYQGAISSQQLNRKQVNKLASILDFPVDLVRTHMMIEGGFNMLQAAMQYVQITQNGYGVCAVSNTYAEESKVKHRALWPLPEVVGLDNPMMEKERPKQKEGVSLRQRREDAKNVIYEHPDFKEGSTIGKGYLKKIPNSRIFVFLGRWVKQKGMDFIADNAEWMVKKHENAQIVMMGPPGDSFGTYCQLKLEALAEDPACRGKVKIIPEFYNFGARVGDENKFAFDFCFMPSRDEPFGYVDIEFGWFGALTVGSITGGLGKVPGVYFIPSNVNSAAHINYLLKKCVDRAMGLSNDQLTALAEMATRYAFPVADWQAALMALYEKAKTHGDRKGTTTQYLKRYRAVWNSFQDDRVVQETNLIGGGAGGTDIMEALLPRDRRDPERATETEFIRNEVGDDEIKDAVAGLVKADAESKNRCCSCKEPINAQDVLAVTQWNAMTHGEYIEDSPLQYKAAPFCGQCNCCTKYITKWLAGTFFGLKRMDLFIALHYLTAPFLQALLVSQLPNPELNKRPMLAGALVLPFAIVFWTKMSMYVQPNRLMVLAVIIRIPMLLRYTVTEPLLHIPLDSPMARTWLFVILNFLAGADQLFVFYNFMGAAIGDVSKLALRMGMCTGILAATSYFGKVAIFHAIHKFPLQFDGSHPLVFIGVLGDLILAILYGCAPAPYREFCLPDWDLKAMFKARKTLKIIAVNIILGAITDPGVSGSAVVTWRTYLPPFAQHGVLWANAKDVYEWLMPLILAVAVIIWSYILYRMPNSAAAVAKAFAFLLAPPALLRCTAAFYLKNNDDNVSLVDGLLISSLVLDVVRSTCIYIALLSVVGSRWRFVSFTTAVLFVRQLLAFVVKFLVEALEGIPDYSSWDYAQRWMPVLIFTSLFQWSLSVWGFLCFDRESSALLTSAKKRIAAANAFALKSRRLDKYLRQA